MSSQSAPANRVTTLSIPLGAVVTVVCCPPAAALVTTVHEFPIPIMGLVSGPINADAAALATILYLTCYGGILPAGALGIAAGTFAAWITTGYNKGIQLAATLVMPAFAALTLAFAFGPALALC